MDRLTSNLRNKLRKASKYLGNSGVGVIAGPNYPKLLKKRWYTGDVNLANPECFQKEDTYGKFLEFCIDENYPLLLSYVMDRGSFPWQNTEYFKQALETGQVPLVKPFIRKKLNINGRYFAFTPLVIAIRNSYTELAKYLLSLPTIKTSINELILASYRGNAWK